MFAMPAAPQHYFAEQEQHSAPARIRAMRATQAARRAMPLSFTGALKLAREQDSFIVTAATPGIKLENVSLELVDQRTLRLRVIQPWTTPPAAKSAAATVPEGTAALEHVALADETAPIRTNDTAADKVDVPADRGKEEASDDAAGSSAEARVQDAAGGTSEVPVHDSVPAAAPYYESAECEQTCINTEVQIVVLDKSLVLPQFVDDTGITCTYTEGLLRVKIPIAHPAPDVEYEALIAGLHEAKTEAAAQLADYEQHVQKCKDKVHEAHTALRTTKAAAGPALMRHSQRLAIVPVDLSDIGLKEGVASAQV